MKKRYIITLLAIGILGAAGGAKAQPQSQTPALSLHDCMEYAISNSTLMRLQEADRDDEQALRRQAIMQAFTPSLSARTYANNQYGRNLDPGLALGELHRPGLRPGVHARGRQAGPEAGSLRGPAAGVSAVCFT